MGMPAGKLTPSPERGLAGGGNSGKTGAEKANYRTLKTGEAMQRLQAARVAMEIVEYIYGSAGDGAISEFVDEAFALEIDAICVAREAMASLVAPAPQPLPEPTTDRPPVEPDSKP